MNLLLKDQQTSIFKKSVQTSSLVGHENMEHHKINEEGIMDQEGVKGQWQFLASSEWRLWCLSLFNPRSYLLNADEKDHELTKGVFLFLLLGILTNANFLFLRSA